MRVHTPTGKRVWPSGTGARATSRAAGSITATCLPWHCDGGNNCEGGQQNRCRSGITDDSAGA